MTRAAKAMPLPPVPLIVISKGRPFQLPSDLPAGLPAAVERAWTASQDEFAGLQPDTPHVIATKSSHNVQIEEPQLVIDAIKQVVERARAHGSAR